METNNPSQIDKKAAAKLLWHRGNLQWKLDPVQKQLYDSYKLARYRTIVWAASRRLGKSWTLCVIAIEQCIQKPNSIVKFIAPTAKHVRTIIKPLFREILIDCPKDLKPSFNTQENTYRFPNGSEVQLAGTDNGHADSLRGGSSHICLVDEAGFCDDLKHIVKSILLPTTTTTNGKIILASTPPISPDHDFVNYMKEADFRGSFIKKIIYDSTRITPETIESIIEEYGGVQSTEFRREYLCEVVTDEEYQIFPEFTKELEPRIVREYQRPAFCDFYVAGDIGFKDLTAFLFAYYDFKNNKLVIEDELVMSGPEMTTERLANSIKAKEQSLFVHPITKEFIQPYLRVCDNNLIVINDLQKLHGLNFIPTAKDDKMSAINNVRIMLASEQIVINPRCKTLIYHMRNGTWNKNKTSFDRSPDAGHYDFCDSIAYLIRNIQKSHNPYPHNFGHGSGDNWFDPNFNAKIDTPIAQTLKDIFKVRRSLK